MCAAYGLSLIHILRKGAGAKRVCAVLGGVLAGFLCLCLVLPPLMQADAGFAALLEGFTQRFSSFVENLFRPLNMGTFLLKWMFALPTALFLYGTVYGSVREMCIRDSPPSLRAARPPPCPALSGNAR